MNTELAGTFPPVPGRTIVQRESLGAAALILQGRDTWIRELCFEQPVLTRVEKGMKTLIVNHREIRAGEGQVLAVAPGQVFDVRNTPGVDGVYQARWMAFSPSFLLKSAEFTAGGPAPLGPVHLLTNTGPEFHDAFTRAWTAVQPFPELPDGVAEARWTEVLAWVTQTAGLFPLVSRPSVAVRTRSLLAAAPQKDWVCEPLARELGMSEATFRRKLASEGLSFSRLLLTVRMEHALGLLQSTDRTVEDIAREVGYESPSKFAQRFKVRFGFPPGRIRERAS